MLKKCTTIFLSLAAAIIIFGFNTATAVDSNEPINPILGDKSFVNKFGHLPDETTNEDLRIKTHLEYVENLLRQKDVSYLSRSEQKKRNHLLDLLHEYWTAGNFPRNYDIAEHRKPCFIDKNGTICAVGYLVEQTAGRARAEQINNSHKYEKIYEMNDESVDNWIATSGLTKEECAMIQPTYGWQYPYYYSNNHITPAYGISTSIFSGLNLSISTVNAIQIGLGRYNNITPIAGLISGAGQTILGAANFPREDQSIYGSQINESQKVLSLINIGLGTETMILSAWNLSTDKKPKSKQTSWNVYNFQTPEDKVGLAFSFSRKF